MSRLSRDYKKPSASIFETFLYSYLAMWVVVPKWLVTVCLPWKHKLLKKSLMQMTKYYEKVSNSNKSALSCFHIFLQPNKVT